MILISRIAYEDTIISLNVCITKEKNQPYFRNYYVEIERNNNIMEITHKDNINEAIKLYAETILKLVK